MPGPNRLPTSARLTLRLTFRVTLRLTLRLAVRPLTKRRVRDLANEIFGVKLPKISPADLHRKLLEKYQVSVEEMFKSLRAETISVDSIKPSVVFEAYARKTGLFGDDVKQDQFPGAFIFGVRKAATIKGDPLPIVWDDKDFAAAIKDVEHITLLKSIADIFAELGLTIEAAPDVEDFIENNLDENRHRARRAQSVGFAGQRRRRRRNRRIDGQKREIHRLSHVPDGWRRQGHPRRRPNRDGCGGLVPPSRLGLRHLRQRGQGAGAPPHSGGRKERRCGSRFQHAPKGQRAPQAELDCR